MADAPEPPKPPAKQSTVLKLVGYGLGAIAVLAVLAFGISAQQPRQSLIAVNSLTS